MINYYSTRLDYNNIHSDLLIIDDEDEDQEEDVLHPKTLHKIMTFRNSVKPGHGEVNSRLSEEGSKKSDKKVTPEVIDNDKDKPVNPGDPPKELHGVALLAFHLKRLKLEKEKRELEEAKNAENNQESELKRLNTLRISELTWQQKLYQ